MIGGPLLEQLAELSPLVVILAKVTLLLAVAWAAHGLLSRANPRWRVLLWRGTAIGLLLIPVCHFLMPPIKFQAPITTITAAANEASDTANGPPPRAVAETRSPAIAILPSSDEFRRQEPVVSEIDSAGDHSWWPFLFAVWGGGCLFCLLRILVGWRLIRLLVVRSEPASGGVQAEFTRVAEDLWLEDKSELRVSAAVTAPILCGLLRPSLLIPTRMAEASRDVQLPAIFAHELAHVQSRDLAWNLVLHAISAVLWFHPMAWFVRAAHAASCESVSDAVATDYLGDVQAYCRTLAKVALDAARPSRLSLAMARTPDVQRRVRALQRRVFDRSLNWQFAGAAVASCLILAIALGGFKAVRAEVLDEPPQSASGLKTTESGEETAQEGGEVARAAAKADPSELVTAETEAAVNKALAFLAARQRKNGSFGGSATGQRDPAMTALCGLAMLAGGSKPGDGPYGAELNKALDFLLQHVHDSGFIGIQDNVGSLYVHAYALRFLAEAHQASKDPRTADAINAAVQLIVESQNSRDGWRYSVTSQDADSSVTSCLVIALESARRAGGEVPRETRQRAIRYLQSCQTTDGGYAYVSGVGASALPRSASVMAALYLSGVDDEQTQKGLDYLNEKANPSNSKSTYYFFAQFHLASALRYAGDEHFRPWYVPSRDQLLEMQQDDGSWSLQYYEPEYATAKACIVLLSPRSPIVRMPADENSADTDAGNND